ncbi:MAG: sodium:dicarboxylate symporter [Bacteroidota bacterium]|nr:sodium:dicarboxylate symporter [Bacteroidota bacterium]
MKKFFQYYKNILLLLAGITIGSIVGLILKERVILLKPIGDMFLNLIFTAVVPLIFFALSSAFANIDRSQKFGKVIRLMLLIFLSTLLIAAFIAILFVWLFPFRGDIPIAALTEKIQTRSIGEQITELLTVNDFFNLLSRKSMLALILFSMLTGIATSHAGEKGEYFHRFLNAGNEVMKKLLSYIMLFAPIGLGAYFAYQTGVFGPKLFGAYASALAVCYSTVIFYYLVFFTLYAFIAGGSAAVKTYWRENIIPSATALGTCSSIATMPANLEASKKMGIPEQIGNIVVPLGATLHKDGSSISSIIKIAVIFAILHKPLSGFDTVLIALGISVVVSIVEGGIPSGGYAGEMMVVAAYSFPIEVLPVIMIIGTLVDPIVTLANATGDTVAAMLVTRFAGKDYLAENESVAKSI